MTTAEKRAPIEIDETAVRGHEPQTAQTAIRRLSIDAVKRRMSAQQGEPLTVVAALDAEAAKSEIIAPVEILDASIWLQQSQPPIEQIMPGLLDRSAKMLINGTSKSRKTFVTLQAAVCLASGMPFLRWQPQRHMRCLILQGEVPAGHFHARLARACKALGIEPAQMQGRLRVINTRGVKFTLDAPPPWLIEAAARADLVFVDPVYKFFDGEENSGADAARFLAGLDLLTVRSGAAVVYVHHTAKGTAGDRQTIDRGSGSGVFARDFDCALFLGQHKEEEDTLVVEPVIRAYAPVAPFCIRFQDGVFRESDHLPIVQRSSDRKGGVKPGELMPTIRTILSEVDMTKTGLVEALQERFGAPRSTARSAIEAMIKAGELDALSGGWPRSINLHLKEQFADCRKLDE